MAAREAGLERLTLLEEPAAAFSIPGSPTISRKSRKKLFRRPDGADLRRGRRHQRFQPHPRFAFGATWSISRARP